MSRLHRYTTAFFILASVMLIGFCALAADPPVVEDPHRDEGRTQAWGANQPCAACHTCDAPTRDKPCLASCPRRGGHFYGEHDAGDGPEIVIIDQLADLYGPVLFAHKLHASMSDMTGGCTNCHHYSEDTGEIPACIECHERQPSQADLRMPSLKGAYHRQCINCHLDWSHENACGFCHEEEGAVVKAAAPDSTDIIGIPHPMIAATETYTYETTYEPAAVVTFHHADHVDLFGQRCVDCHRGETCSSCHDLGNGKKEKINHVTSCFTCHAERDCAFCHSDKSMPRFDHAVSTGWDLDPYHKDLECTRCHSRPDHFKHPTGVCGDCHIHWEAGSFQHRVTGLELSEDHVDLDCADCHLDRNFNERPHCEDCHDEAMYPEYLPGEKVSRR